MPMSSQVGGFQAGQQLLSHRGVEYVVAHRGGQYEWSIIAGGKPSDASVTAKFRAAVMQAQAAIDQWLDDHRL